MEGTIGEIRLFAAAFAPKNWAYCNGSVVAIRSNTALFSILGNTYGGDGKDTFGLPDMQGRTAIGSGQGPGLSYYKLGDNLGSNTVALTSYNLAPHTHPASLSVVLPAYSDGGDSNTPAGSVLASKPSMYTSEVGDADLKASQYNITVGVVGTGLPLSINQPSLGMNYIICMYGIFPTRQ